MNLTNYHTHSTFCDGHSPMEDFVKAAVAMGFTSLGFSSHAPLPYRTRWTMDAPRMLHYLAEFERLRAAYSSLIDLFVGLEIDYLTPAHCPASEYFTSLPLDFRIGSVHPVIDDDGRIHEIDCPVETFQSIVNEYFSGDVDEVVRRYFARLMSMVAAGGFDIVGHADKMHALAQTMHPSLTELPWFRRLIGDYFEAIAEHGYIIEMNTKKYETAGRFFPDAQWYSLLHGLGVPVTVNSDAHFPERLNSGRLEGLKQLKRAGYTHVMQLQAAGRWCAVEISTE